MNRPWKTWLVFGLCLAVLLAAMGWVSLTALRLDQAQARAQRQAGLEEKVRLALWRMDSMLAPLIVQESARPYFAYTPFHAAERAYGKMFNPLNQGEVLVPSPLLDQVSSNVLLHFQYGADRRLTSPQVPEGNQRTLAESQFVSRERIEAAAGRLRQFERIMAQEASPELARLMPASSVPRVAVSAQSPSLPGQQAATPAAWLNGEVLLAAAPAAPTAAAEGGQLALNNAVVINPPVQQRLLSQSQSKRPQPAQGDFQQQVVRNDEELQARAQSVQQAYDLNLKNVQGNFYRPPSRGNVSEGVIKPLWFGDTLVLVRRVTVQGQEYVQGCWLDWAGLKGWLQGAVKDLLPEAALEPLRSNGTDPQARLLAALPARLVPGAPLAGSGALASPILLALVLAWGCMVLASVAVGLLLRGALSLSERRGAFVSAVTHELRTPLTTFRMYSEMLADDMVPDPARRRQYLQTLCSEASRLSHLVENVLAFARLERGSARRRVEQITLGQLMERVVPRLADRAGQAGMQLAQDADSAALQTRVHVDVSAVEQILFNLVDNACKYATPTATEKVIHLEALPENGRFALLRVRDHGQGISAEGAKRLFKPFSKSAHEAAHTAPGVGLGLALCRRLSRSMGGDLRLDTLVRDGACFVLTLPVSAPGAASIA